MTQSSRVVVVGAGSWGTAFACLLRDRGHQVTIAARDAAQAEAINATGRNPRYAQAADLAGVAAAPIGDAPVADAELVVVAVPSRVFGEVVSTLPGDAPLLSLTKGLDPASGERLSTLVRRRPVVVLSGPNIAEEIVRGLPAAAVVASDDLELAVRVQVAVNSVLYRVYVSDDVPGVELCAAAKNVIALAAGGADGLSLGDNAKAALVARGLAEMRRLAESAGARPDTFAGLAGMGDLIVTCTSQRSRNRHVGEQLGTGKKIDEIIASMNQVAEGVKAASVIMEFAEKYGLPMPIAREVDGVVNHGSTVEDAYRGLAAEKPGHEVYGSGF